MLSGFDVSKWNPIGDASAAKDFCICKSSEGIGYTDPKFKQNIEAAKKAGKLLGCYHFARPDGNKSGAAEADWFVSVVKPYLKQAILVLDWEVGPLGDTAWVKAFLDRVYSLTGVRPLIYMSASVVNQYNWSAIAKDYGLWIAGYPAKYNVKNPPEPKVADMPYKTGAWKTWAIWQYSSSKGTLDRNIANMDKTAWEKYAGKVTPTPTPAPTPTPTPAPAVERATKWTVSYPTKSGGKYAKTFDNLDAAVEQIGTRIDKLGKGEKVVVGTKGVK